MKEINLKDWPPIEGRYLVGNKTSPVAVCTNGTVDGIDLEMDKVAIAGKCVTENIGMEKIIQNIVSNPNIRFLLLCGKISKGHFVDQAFLSLKKNGIDENKRIIGAKGPIPFLKGINKELIERFRNQIEPINLMPEQDSKKIMEKVEDYSKRNPGLFTGEAVEISKVEEIEARSCPDWIADPKGFFIISVDRENKRIIAEHFENNKLSRKIVGDTADKICKTIVYLGLISDFAQTREHSMYIARELQKAEFALKNGLDYEQDTSLAEAKPEAVDNKDNKNNQSAGQFDWVD
ncbi:MAG: tetrahydromethanopterin S-methyltransferase subunit A [Candidatus Parcubacteria bacterium]|nr:tetrahydromethanopterin S-methyltransferase subunit A [Candidatus Parcubacteria bacterium]